jgi:hypothetical protein
MTKIRLFALLIGVFAAMTAPLHAGVIFQFDELGNFAWSQGGGPYVPLADGLLEPDPTDGVTGDALVFDLTSELDTFELFNGDVPISGFGGLAGDLRFTNSGGALTGSETCGAAQCLMIFYVFDSDGLPADVGNISTSFLTTQTPGAVLGDGQFSYSFAYEAGVLTYDGTIVPEPAPALMLLFGLAAFAFLRKRQKAILR